MDEYKLYARSLLAMKNEVDGSVSSGHCAGFLMARNYDEARTMSFQSCKEEFPEDEGWKFHRYSLLLIPEEVMVIEPKGKFIISVEYKGEE